MLKVFVLHLHSHKQYLHWTLDALASLYCVGLKLLNFFRVCVKTAQSYLE